MSDVENEVSASEMKPFEHQVAGHRREGGKPGMLVSVRDGTILKPVQEFPRGEQEIKFYERVFQNQNHIDDIAILRQFVPFYHGIVKLSKENIHEDNDRFLQLQDITRHFRFPCILDIKVGKCTWDQNADEGKIAREKAKCPLQSVLGFRVAGLKVYNYKKRCYDFYDRYFWRNLSTEEELHLALSKYCDGAADHERKQIMTSVITKLKEIQQWFLKQKIFSFRSSSILIIYEGRHDMRESTTQGCQNEVKMIDFSHVFENNDTDFNYLNGVKNIIAHMEKCLTLIDHNHKDNKVSEK